jgi:hypothetical protein
LIGNFLKDALANTAFASIESMYKEPDELTTNFILVLNFGLVRKIPNDMSSIWLFAVLKFVDKLMY